MRNFLLIIIVALGAGYLNSCQDYHPPPEFKPEYEEPKPRLQTEQPVKVRLRYNRGLA